MANSQALQSDTEYTDLSSLPSPAHLTSSEPPRYQSSPQLPNRYRKRNTDQSEIDEREASREERRIKARETRRTRRTIRQKQLQQSQELVQQEKQVEVDIHAKIDVSSDSDASSVDENYDVASLAESIPESLT